MNGADQIQSRSAEDLRQAFDLAFAEPVATKKDEMVHFISIRVAGESHAIRVSEITGLHTDIVTIPCPSSLPEFLGIAAFRGVLTPVYDLAAILGRPAGTCRWIVTVADGDLAFAFDAFESHFQIATAASSSGNSTPTAHVVTVARDGDRAWPVIDLPSVIATIKHRATAASSLKEH